MGFEMKKTRPVRTILDQHRLDPACPECGKRVELTVGEARDNPTRTCPNGHEFTVDATQLERAARDLQRQVDDLLG
jgi:hypothetical protein